MGCAPCKEEKRRRPPKNGVDPVTLDIDALSEVLQQRASELSTEVMEGPLNNKRIPDFLERRMIETMIFTVFSTVLLIMIPKQHTTQSKK